MDPLHSSLHVHSSLFPQHRVLRISVNVITMDTAAKCKRYHFMEGNICTTVLLTRKFTIECEHLRSHSQGKSRVLFECSLPLYTRKQHTSKFISINRECNHSTHPLLARKLVSCYIFFTSGSRILRATLVKDRCWYPLSSSPIHKWHSDLDKVRQQ